MLIAIDGIKYEINTISYNSIRVHGTDAIDHMQNIFNDNHEVVMQAVEGNDNCFIIRILDIVCISFNETYIEILYRVRRK